MSRAGSAMDGPYGAPRRQNTFASETSEQTPYILPRHNTSASGFSQASQPRNFSRAGSNRSLGQYSNSDFSSHYNSVIPMTTIPSRQGSPMPSTGHDQEHDYTAFNPEATRAPSAPPLTHLGPPRRQMTDTFDSHATRDDYFHPAPVQRSVTAPVVPGAYDDILDDYGSD